MNRLMSFAAFFLLLSSASAPKAQEQSTQLQTPAAIKVLEDYFDLLASNNLVSAEGLWTQAAIDRSSRFNIAFDDIRLKIDATSPIMRNLDVMREHLIPAVSQVRLLEDNYVRLDFKKVVNGQAVEYPYYEYFDGSYFWLTYPQDYFTRKWPVTETKYYRIHTEPGTENFLHPVLIEQADRFVEKVADSLALPESSLREIAEKKIEFFFCKSDSSVLEITGQLTRGLTDLASNDIISAHFPHNHELLHLLVNIKLKKLPLATQPILREGIAVHYGGRWGKAPTSLVYLGAFLQENGIVQVDSIITMDRFETQAGADMAYPVAGLFTAFLLEKLGQDRYFQLYRDLSGGYSKVSTMLAPEVKRIIFQATGAESWESLVGDFLAYCTHLQSEKAVFAPGASSKGRGGFDDTGIQVKLHNGWVSLTFTGESADTLTGNLLFGYDKRLEGIRSLLFDEQYPNAGPFPGFRWGIRFDANEAGLYDYATNQLVGKYIFGITPSADFRSADGKAVYVRYLLELADGAMPTQNDHRLLKN